jgi:hypothetical protein
MRWPGDDSAENQCSNRSTRSHPRGRIHMAVTEKREVIRKLSFGNQVAEEERETLKDYFVKTQAWDRINNGDIDIIYGI